MHIDDAEIGRLRDLEAAVRRVVTQRADAICWRDAYTDLARLVGVEFLPELICDREKMLANCRAFVDSLHGGPYVPVYVERSAHTAANP